MRRNFTRTCPPLRVPSGLVYGLKFACAFLMLVGFLPRPAVSQEEESSLPAVVIEEALYKATVHHDELIQGELTLILSHRVPGAAIVDWTDVEIPVHDLTWVGKTPSEASPVVWGTAPDGRVLVVIPSEARRLTGRWSLRGTPFGEKTHFPMRLPEALRTSLQILTESSERVSVGNGWVRLKASESLSGMSEWEIELGRNRETLLSVGPPTPIQPSATWRYSDDSLYIAQRDGFLIQCDFLVEPLDRGETASPLVLRLPGSFEPQSLTLAGIPVSWETVPGSRRDIKIPLQAGDLMSRTKLRLRGFQQTSWGRRRTLPRILMQNGRLIERFLSLRVEPPLQVHALQSDKMIQTELAADESGGEFWRFQATRPDGVLAVEINQPRAEMNARIDSLLDLRTTGYWSATVVTIEVEKGTAFESRLVLPKGWEPVSLQEVGTDSRVAAWAFQEGTLSIHWQNPATRSTPRQALLLSYIPSISMDRGVEFQVPFAREVKSQQSQLSLVLNPDQRLEIQEGQSWNPVDSVEIPAVIRRDSDIAQKLGQLSQSKLLAFSQQSRSAPLPLQFETRKESESASATSELEPVLVSNPDMPNGGDTPTDETAPAAACELTTSIGLAETQSLVHHAQYHFDAPWNPGLGEIRLPATVRLSSVSVDGLAVSVLRDGDLLRFPQDLKSARLVELTYVTDRTPGIWGTHHIVPIPILASSRHGVQWSLRLPDELQLGEISLPGRVTERIPPPNSIVSWLGPLGRPPDKSIFLPFSASHWRRLFEGGNDGFSGSSHREYLMIFPNVGDTIQFSTWDAGRTAGLSWVAMIACLMIGTGSRLFRVAWIVQLTAVWLAMLMVAASLLPPALAVICGAMVLGSLLSVLIPRRVIERPDFLDWSSTVRRRSRTIAGAVCLLIVMNPELLRSQPTESSAGDFQPTSLIRSATYDLVWGNPGAPPSVRATIDALLPKGTPSPLLKLPFNNVVFPATTECLANGSRVPLIPSVNADALLVDLSSILSEADTEDAGSVWWPITLEMEFLAKPIGQRGNEQPEFAFIDAIVPKVLDSELEISAESVENTFHRWGERSPLPNGGALVALGGIGRLSNSSRVASTGSDVPMATTILEITSFGANATTRFAANPGSLPETLVLEFPGEAVIHSITGAPVIDWYLDVSPEGMTSAYCKIASEVAGSITIDWELPAETDIEEGLTIPEIPLARTARQRHLLAVVADSPLQVELLKPPTQRLLTSEEIQGIPDFSNVRASFAVAFASPESISLKVRELPPLRDVQILESIELRRSELLWNASLTIDVTRLPVFRHRLRIQPDFEVTAVLLGLPGKRTPVRYSRNEEYLEVFLPGGQLKVAHLTIEGRADLSLDSWRTLPKIELLDATVSRADLRVTDQTNWEIQLETEVGGQTTIAEVRDAPMETTGTTRLIGEFRDASLERPVRARVVIPPSAVSADGVSLLAHREEGSWVIQSMFQLNPKEIPLRRAIFLIPSELKFERIRPAHFRHSLSPNPAGQTLTVLIPERYSAGTSITVLTQLSEEHAHRLNSLAEHPEEAQLPLPRPESAVLGQHRLLIPTDPGMSPTRETGVAETVESWPAWAPVSWERALKEKAYSMFRVLSDQITLEPNKLPQGSSPGQFLLEESVVWTGQSQEFCGTSILWMELAEASRLTFHLRPGQEIVRVVDRSPQGAPLPLTDDRTTVLLPHREGIVSLRVDWVDRTPSGEVMLLNYRDLQPQNRLLAVVSGRDQVLRGNEAHQLTWLATVLTRWESLLECLDQSRIGEIPIDGPLLKTIRRCQRTAGESLSQVVPSRSDELLERYRQLEEDWHTRQERFAITSDLAELSGTAPVDAFSVLLTQREHFVPVAWYDLSERAAPLRVHLRTRISTALVPILAVLLLGLSVTVVARYQARILSFREQCARHPILMLSVLGLVWWLFLVPSVVGLLLMLLAGVTRIGLILLPHAQSHSGGDRGSTVIGERPESAI